MMKIYNDMMMSYNDDEDLERYDGELQRYDEDLQRYDDDCGNQTELMIYPTIGSLALFLSPCILYIPIISEMFTSRS